MAVYTHVTDDEVAALLTSYGIGTLVSLKGITSGVENSNYLLTTDQDSYIFTIFEKRVNKNDLPFFLGLKEHLANRGVPCPLPVKTREGALLSSIQSKPCTIVSFLAGKSTHSIRNAHVKELGKHMAHLHLAAHDFKLKRENDLSIASWQSLYDSIKHRVDEILPALSQEIEAQLAALRKHWPINLPQGIIHGDLFPDNVFFKEKTLAGLIDFYFACNDTLMYDLAICLNAWCFEKGNDFNITKAQQLLSSYHAVRPMSSNEFNALPILASGAAMRFLLTRLYDWFHRDETAVVVPKDPLEYLYRLRFHQQVESYQGYVL